MKHENSMVCVYQSHAEAEEGVKRLQAAGFDMRKLSIVGRDIHTEETPIGFYNTGERMSYWGKQGAFWGGLWGFLFGSAFFLVPGVGPLVMAGPVVSWIIGAFEGAVLVGGMSALGAALYSSGIPKDSVVKYETAIKSGGYLLMAHGTSDEVASARQIIASVESEHAAVHLAPAAAADAHLA